ncbi:ATP-binding cassette domain-containing protein [Phytoactinopolyspora alkaliphila]|uniref:ATP-binding cassette domain-containing protein n=1 Tax=Phytoactinopolyspora alkaliphila TaxID=1783498 RepID=A0A6N9YJ15_9ACTN|nr:ATP-binding cassette domain-containing protein [Phytoactinopolyspora alkaliphila]NED94859.1 ATP-binding cassette domain-containing protein [Phytoactinopolyspora alkaliphila]
MAIAVAHADSATDAIIDVRSLSRRFTVRSPGGRLRRTKKTVDAVDALTFSMQRGAAIGYIGANGAGKSTTIKMITGILVPSSGSVVTCGLDPVRQRKRLARRIGVVFGQRTQLWWDLPLRESYRTLAAIHRLPGDSWVARRDELIDRLDLASFVDTPVRQLSLGQRIRGEIAAALLHSPELLILDEPTIGLDVLSKERLRVFLAEQRALHGTSLLLTTHDMDDVQRLTERLVVVDHGQMIYDGDLPGLVHRVGAERVMVLDFAAPTPPLEDVPGTRLVHSEPDGMRQRLSFVPGHTTAGAVLASVSARGEVRDLSIEEPDIEDVVRRLYLSTEPYRQ